MRKCLLSLSLLLMLSATARSQEVKQHLYVKNGSIIRVPYNSYKAVAPPITWGVMPGQKGFHGTSGLAGPRGSWWRSGFWRRSRRPSIRYRGGPAPRPAPAYVGVGMGSNLK